MKKPGEIEGLYKIKPEDYSRLYSLLKRAFEGYPEYEDVYDHDPIKSTAGFHMVLTYYGAYNLHFGGAYSLDENMNEAIVILHSDFMDYSDERCEEANCNNEAFRKAASVLTEEEVQKWFDFNVVLDSEEKQLDLPNPHFYVDFVAVSPDHQGEGRGGKLLRKICEYGKSINTPIMLFTNRDDEVAFYKHMGFRVAAQIDVPEAGLHSTYFVYDVQEDR